MLDVATISTVSSQHLRRCLDPKDIPKTPCQEVFGCLGFLFLVKAFGED